MINQVVVAGRLVADPAAAGAGLPAVDLRVAVEAPPRGEREVPVRPVEVVVRVFGERRGEVVRRYLTAGRSVLVQGRLERDGGALLVVCDQFEFMEDRLETRGLWRPPQGVPGLGRAPARDAAAA